MKNITSENKLVKFKDGYIDKESYNFLVELERSGKYSWEDIKVKVDIKYKQIVWKGNLDIKGTSIKKIKAKKIKGNIKAFEVESLKEIEVEEIWGDLNIIGTSVESIKVKKVLGNVFAYGIDTLKELEAEEIGGFLDVENSKIEKIKIKKIKGGLDANGTFQLKELEAEEIGGFLDVRGGTDIDFQLDIIKRINNGNLKEVVVDCEKYFGGNVEGIERLCENENLVIPGNLNIKETSVESIKVKKVLGSVFAYGLRSLTEIEVKEEILGDLDIRETTKEFQKKTKQKIDNKKLKVNGKFIYNKEKISQLKLGK